MTIPDSHNVLGNMQDKTIFKMGLEAFTGALGEYRKGNIVNSPLRIDNLQRHLTQLSKTWDQRFPGFPKNQSPWSSFGGVRHRGQRDEYLKNIITSLLEPEGHDLKNRTIVNPVCVFGRHARDLASRLQFFKVMATDINPLFNRLYKHLPGTRTPDNYQFQQDSIFNPKLQITPAAVVFFGACGSMSDAAIDYAIESNSPYLVCRTCCHDNIGGNTTITRRPTLLNRLFRLKNLEFSRQRRKGTGQYFSPKYSQDHYPTSQAAKRLTNSGGFLRISQCSVDSDTCRTIIDLDRYLHLTESGYNVWYKGELFVAEKIKETL